MSTLLPPEPPSEGDDQDAFRDEPRDEPSRSSRGSRRRSRPPRRPPSREELLLRLHALTNMVLLGAIEPAQANAIRGAIDSMLRAMGGGSAAATRAGGPIDFQRWRKILRENPGIADELAQFFTDEQLDQLFDGFDDKEDADDLPAGEGAA